MTRHSVFRFWRILLSATFVSFSRAHYLRRYPRISARTCHALAVRGGGELPPNPSSYYGYSSLSGYGQPQQADDDVNLQDRVEMYRNYQREHALATENSPRDERGRVKLLTSVSKGSRALIFFILMWRDVHLYEVADMNKKGLLRLIFVLPLVILFIANMAGAVASLTSPSHSAKKRLKAILNLDKFLEVLLLLFYFIRLTIAPSKYTPREVYIANVMHSVFFILQSQAFTKLSWDDNVGQIYSPQPHHQTTPAVEQEEEQWYYNQEDQLRDQEGM